METIPPRRWHNYGVRALFVLALIAALPAWRLRVEIDELAAEHDAIVKLKAAGAHVDVVPASPRWFWALAPDWLAPHRDRGESVQSWGTKHVAGKTDIRLIARLTHLKRLVVAHAEAITDDDLAACRGMNELKGLCLTDCPQVTNEGLRHFSHARGMVNLDLNSTAVGDGCMDTVAGFSHLESLGLLFTDVTDASMPQIMSLRGLRSLALPPRVTSPGLHDIARLDQLFHLDVWLPPGEDVEVLSRVCRLPKLELLTVRGEGLTDAGLNIILGMDGLKQLHIYGGALSPSGVSSVKELATSIAVFVDLPDFFLDVRHDLPRRPPGPRGKNAGNK